MSTLYSAMQVVKVLVQEPPIQVLLNCVLQLGRPTSPTVTMATGLFLHCLVLWNPGMVRHWTMTLRVSSEGAWNCQGQCHDILRYQQKLLQVPDALAHGVHEHVCFLQIRASPREVKTCSIAMAIGPLSTGSTSDDLGCPTPLSPLTSWWHTKPHNWPSSKFIPSGRIKEQQIRAWYLQKHRFKSDKQIKKGYTIQSKNFEGKPISKK